jgi:hypothetical protein
VEGAGESMSGGVGVGLAMVLLILLDLARLWPGMVLGGCTYIHCDLEEWHLLLGFGIYVNVLKELSIQCFYRPTLSMN